MFPPSVKYGVLTCNLDKIESIGIKASSVHIMTDVRYVPLVEQPVGLAEARMCMRHRYEHATYCGTVDFIVCIESALVPNDNFSLVREATLTAFIVDGIFFFAPPHYSDAFAFPDLEEVLGEVRAKGITFGKYLQNKGLTNDAKNWHRPYVGRDRLELLTMAFRVPLPHGTKQAVDLVYESRRLIAKQCVVIKDPIKEVDFFNVYPIQHVVSDLVMRRMVNVATAHKADLIVGMASRGLLYGPLLAHLTGLPFVPITDPGKLPQKRVYQECYRTECRDNNILQVEMSCSYIMPENVIVVDDILVTGGRLACCQRLLGQIWPDASLHALTVVGIAKCEEIAKSNLQHHYSSVTVLRAF